MRLVSLVTIALAVAPVGASSGMLRGAPGPAALSFTHLVGRYGDGHWSVWIAAANGSHAHEVVANGYRSALSHDGRWLMFERLKGGASGSGRVLLSLLDLVTGRTRSLGEIGESFGNERWSPTKAVLAVTQRRGFFLINAASGTRTKLLGGRVGSFDFTPDGNSVVLTLGSGVPGMPSERSDLFQLGLSTHVLERLTHDGHSRSPLVSETGIAYVRFKNAYDAPEAWLIRRDGRGPRLLARCCESKQWLSHGDATRGYETVAVSRDGKRLLTCRQSTVECPPVAIELPSGRQQAFPGIGKIIPPKPWETATALDLSPDGRRVLVAVGPPHDGPGRWRLYALSLSGGTPTLLARDAVDGRWRR